MEVGSDTEHATHWRDRVLFDLAKRDKSRTQETFRALTEAAAAVLGVARVSIWRLVRDPACIICEDSFLRDEQRHARGDVLFARDYPSYFRAICEHRVIAADFAQNDPRTHELTDRYLEPRSIISMMDVPIWHEGQLYGVLCHEHVGAPRHWTSDEEQFAANLADLASLSIEAGERMEAQLRWETVVNAISEAVFVLDENGNAVQMNPAARQLIAYAGGGVTVDERRALLELTDDSGRVIQLGGPAIPNSISARMIRGEIVHVRITKTGERKSFRLTTMPLYDGGDKVHGAIMVMADVTEEVYLEQLKREMLSALAHELKTPVTIVKGYSQHLARLLNFPDRGKPMLSAIERAANRLDRLIEDLIQVSGIRLGRLTLERQKTDLAELARTVAQRMSATLGEQHRIEVKTPTCAAFVLADRPRMEQVIRRLVDNAIRYSPRGGDICLDVTCSGDSVVVSVTDPGVGIPDKDKPHIFELFFRAHARTPYDVGGLGIGLFLAREIARRQDGEMWFESTEGKGSTFFLRLPRAPQD